jgi:type IV secretion system protein VirB9
MSFARAYIRAILPALALLAAPPALHAEAETAVVSQPAGEEETAPADPRLVHRQYDPAEVVRIEGKPNVQATIKFGDNEMIENVAIGDSNSWQVTPNKRANLLFVKPLTAKAATNMTVVTDRRTYLFDLVTTSKANPLYVLSFIYPDEPDEEETLADGASEIEMQAATDPYAVADPAQLNFAWSSTGDGKLVPERTFDDGNSTFLTWPTGRDVPAILIRDHQGTEGPVNYAVRGNTIVVDGVPREIILRSGEDAATLTNSGPERASTNARDTVLAHAEERN